MLFQEQGILPEVASSSSAYKHNTSMNFSPDCLKISSETSSDPIKHSSFPVHQDPSKKNLRGIPEDYIEKNESVPRNKYNSVNDPLAAAQQQVNE